MPVPWGIPLLPARAALGLWPRHVTSLLFAFSFVQLKIVLALRTWETARDLPWQKPGRAAPSHVSVSRQKTIPSHHILICPGVSYIAPFTCRNFSP